ncbi:MAG: gliding motility-associated ABC transporter ATP-binding subunit GldA [Bacteroidota bacterium]
MSLRVKDLTKIYGQQKAIDSVSFDAEKGEIIGLLGPNGAGKSTTMKILTGFLPQTSGSAEVNGYDVVRESRKVRRNVGYLPENNPLYMDMFVHEYLNFTAGCYSISGTVLKHRVGEMIELCGLGLEQHKKIKQLSKGYRQRVGLAQALIHDPQTLILDEPTTGLDPNQIVEIRKLIQEISQNKLVVLSTHIMQEVKAICSRALIINKGKIVADDQLDQLKANTSQEEVFVIEFKSPIDESLLEDVEGLLRIEKFEDLKYRFYCSKDIREELIAISLKEKLGLLSLSVEEQDLEYVFRSLTK